MEREVKAKQEKVEREAVKAEVDCKARLAKAEEEETAADDKQKRLIAEVTKAFDVRNALLDDTKAAHAKLCEVAKRVDQLRGKFEEAERNKVELRLQLERLNQAGQKGEEESREGNKDK